MREMRSEIHVLSLVPPISAERSANKIALS